METYANRSGQSGVRFYEIGESHIDVTFSDGKSYRYTYRSASSTNVEEMKRLAKAGLGLNSFITRRVKKNYESKW